MLKKELENNLKSKKLCNTTVIILVQGDYRKFKRVFSSFWFLYSHLLYVNMHNMSYKKGVITKKRVIHF